MLNHQHESISPLSGLKVLNFNKEVSKKATTKVTQTPDWVIISLGSNIENGNIVLKDEKLHTPKDLDRMCEDQVKKTRVLETRGQPVLNATFSNFSRAISEGTISSEVVLTLLEKKNVELLERKGLTAQLKNALNPEHEIQLNKSYTKTVERTRLNTPKPVVK